LCGGTIARLAAPHISRLPIFSHRSHCFFLPNQGSGVEQMMEEAVKLAMESSAGREGNNNNNLSSSNSSFHGDNRHNQKPLSHYPQKSIQEQPPEHQQQHLPQGEITTRQQQEEEEIQKQKGYYHYFRRNQELDLTQRYAPKDNCWIWTCLTRGPFQFCKS
jgi:adenosylmethionine-8-amino-7-oxononanoate aminotransferase